MSLFANLSSVLMTEQAGPIASTATPTLLDMLIMASKAVDLLEGRKPRHALRVAVLAHAIAHKMELPDRETSALIYAGLLHDVGLVQTASNVAAYLRVDTVEKQVFSLHPLLNARVPLMQKPDDLDPQAWELLTAHPQQAASWLESVYMSKDVADIVACHHELYDGSGYPLGISRDAIPLGGRILALADVLESLMETISGLESRKDAAQEFLERHTSGKFDPLVVSACLNLVSEPDSNLFLRRLYSLEVEKMLEAAAPKRNIPLSGETLLNVCKALGQLSDNLTPRYTADHSRRVAEVAFAMARNIEIPMEQCGELAVAGLLHDLGNLGVPITVLMTSRTLKDQEWEQVQAHPHLTEEMMRNVPGFENIALWSAEHHEKLNATGYPARKRGYAISLGGRILAICDTYVALTSPRPYRSGMYEPMDALPIIGQGRHRHFDNRLVSVLREAVLNDTVCSAVESVSQDRIQFL